MFCFSPLQELQIQVLSAEIESLKNSQNLSSSAHLEALIEENSRLKYRFNILNRVSDGDGVFDVSCQCSANQHALTSRVLPVVAS